MMAYQSFDELAPALRNSAGSELIDAIGGGFTPLEWRVVAMARGEPLGSTEPRRGLRAFLGRLFGLRAANRLADPRLERLRRTAILAWSGRLSPYDPEAARFLIAGFNPQQLLTLIATAQPSEANAPASR